MPSMYIVECETSAGQIQDEGKERAGDELHEVHRKNFAN